METTTDEPPATRGRLTASVLLGCCVALTLPTGLVVGWFATELMLFGAHPTAEDHQVAAGAYGAAAAALLLGAVALRVHGTTRWQVPVALASAGLLAALALSSAMDAATSSEPGSGINHWWDGAGGVLACPWTWPLVVMGVLAPFRRRPGGTDPAPGGGGWG
jgi:purine-cytosine permease-like protein